MRNAAILLSALTAAVLSARAEQVTYYKDIAPIVYHSCAPCHRPGEPGPFPLLTYTDVRKRGPQIVAVIKRRYMPPWLPEAGYGDFQEQRRLTEPDPAIEEWVAKARRPARPPMRHRCQISFPAGNLASRTW